MKVKGKGYIFWNVIQMAALQAADLLGTTQTQGDALGYGIAGPSAPSMCLPVGQGYGI
jgi:hypothetical protein